MDAEPNGPDDTGEKQAKGRFPKGVSGNPSGRPPGRKNATTLMVEAMLGDEAEEITRALIDRAKAGNAECLKLVMDRLAPVRRDRPVEFTLPEIDGLTDLPVAHRAIMDAVAAGELTPSEGSAVAAILEARGRAVELAKLEERIAALEGKKP